MVSNFRSTTDLNLNGACDNSDSTQKLVNCGSILYVVYSKCMPKHTTFNVLAEIIKFKAT